MDWKSVETKWLGCWSKDNLFSAPDQPKNPQYLLEMFAYPSGDIHMGHFRNYTIGDAIYRYKRLKEYDVLHPFGWDAFGLPAEQAAIKHSIHPKEWTLGNINTGRITLKRMGLSYDWNREVITCDPSYYKWTQWLFLVMLERGLAYQSTSNVNWCETCKTILANEQAGDGKCWRCGNDVLKKELDNCWFFKITEYAERLLKDLDRLDSWPANVKSMQKNWIGKSEGVEVDFKLEGTGENITVFTTRIDTIFGVTFVTLAPESRFSARIPTDDNKTRVLSYIDEALGKSELSRRAKAEKDGVFTGRYAINPFNGEKVPVWVSDYVLMSYGTGAVMGVPAHDERDYQFAMKYQLSVKEVIKPPSHEKAGDCYTGDGMMVNSGDFTNKSSEDGRELLLEFAVKNNFGRKKINYRIRDWLISRQRYWGTPIPVVYCDKCDAVPVGIDSLPVLLPDVKDFIPKGRSPLEDSREFVDTRCPRCGEEATRCADTMDTFVDSSFYLFRYLNPKEDSKPWDKNDAMKWLPVDLYIGGVEHANGHLLYFRFITKVLHDAGYLDIDEPAVRLFNQGMVLDRNGDIMSKSKGNVTAPAEILDKYGVDVSRLTMFFAAPSDQEVRWNPDFIKGITRFYDKVYTAISGLIENGYGREEGGNQKQGDLSELFAILKRKLNLVIKRATESLENDLAFNTTISQLMEMFNIYLENKENLSPSSKSETDLLNEFVRSSVILLAPFAPFMAEELWEMTGSKSSILRGAKWPLYSEEWAIEIRPSIPIQINGKLRDKVSVGQEDTDEAIRGVAMSLNKVKKYLENKEVVKFIVVRDRKSNLPKLVNLVVK